MGTVNIEATHKVTTTVYDFTDNTVEERTCYCESYEEAACFFYSVYDSAYYCLFNQLCITDRSDDGDKQTIVLVNSNYQFVAKLEKIVSD